jgi:hypothetical protein
VIALRFWEGGFLKFCRVKTHLIVASSIYINSIQALKGVRCLHTNTGYMKTRLARETIRFLSGCWVVYQQSPIAALPPTTTSTT